MSCEPDRKACFSSSFCCTALMSCQPGRKHSTAPEPPRKKTQSGAAIRKKLPGCKVKQMYKREQMKIHVCYVYLALHERQCDQSHLLLNRGQASGHPVPSTCINSENKYHQRLFIFCCNSHLYICHTLFSHLNLSYCSFSHLYIHLNFPLFLTCIAVSLSPFSPVSHISLFSDLYLSPPSHFLTSFPAKLYIYHHCSFSYLYFLLTLFLSQPL